LFKTNCCSINNGSISNINLGINFFGHHPKQFGHQTKQSKKLVAKLNEIYQTKELLKELIIPKNNLVATQTFFGCHHRLEMVFLVPTIGKPKPLNVHFQGLHYLIC
jgi:hypothetical protein